jgi:hypothetical protein
MLSVSVDLGGFGIGQTRRVAVPGLLGGAGDRLGMSRLLGQHPRDHAIRLDLRRHVPLVVAEVLHPPGLLDHQVEDPLLVVPPSLGVHEACPFVAWSVR